MDINYLLKYLGGVIMIKARMHYFVFADSGWPTIKLQQFTVQWKST